MLWPFERPPASLTFGASRLLAWTNGLFFCQLGMSQTRAGMAAAPGGTKCRVSRSGTVELAKRFNGLIRL